MALPTASDNPFPSLLITEGTVPTSPAAGKQRLYVNSTSHRLVRVNSSGVETQVDGVNSGTSFPASPATGELFHRTDKTNALWRYDGTRWRSETVFKHEHWLAASVTVDVGHTSPQIGDATDIWVVDLQWMYNVPGNHSGTKYWTCALKKYDNTTVATLATLTTDQSSTDWQAPAATAVGALVGLTNKMLWFSVTKVSTPDASTLAMMYRYQLVAT